MSELFRLIINTTVSRNSLKHFCVEVCTVQSMELLVHRNHMRFGRLCEPLSFVLSLRVLLWKLTIKGKWRSLCRTYLEKMTCTVCRAGLGNWSAHEVKFSIRQIVFRKRKNNVNNVYFAENVISFQDNSCTVKKTDEELVYTFHLATSSNVAEY